MFISKYMTVVSQTIWLFLRLNCWSLILFEADRIDDRIGRAGHQEPPQSVKYKPMRVFYVSKNPAFTPNAEG